MKQHILSFFLTIIVAAMTIILPAQASESLQVAVSIPPQVYFVKQIGGDFVDVLCMLPEGGTPHTYEPTAQQMRQLSQAELYIRVKVDFENAWWEKMASANPQMSVVDSTEGVDFIEGVSHEHHDEDGETHEHENEHPEQDAEHHGRDPHIWLSPRMVKIQAENIYQGLVAVDPEHQERYAANKEAFLSELDSLDSEIQEALAGLKTRKFMIFHPAWSYFARDYELEQIPVEIGGKEPSAREMMELMKLAQKEQTRVIFVQPQTSRRSAETIATQIGGRVEILDPLAADWLGNLRRVASSLAETLSE